MTKQVVLTYAINEWSLLGAYSGIITILAMLEDMELKG